MTFESSARVVGKLVGKSVSRTRRLKYFFSQTVKGRQAAKILRQRLKGIRTGVKVIKSDLAYRDAMVLDALESKIIPSSRQPKIWEGFLKQDLAWNQYLSAPGRRVRTARAIKRIRKAKGSKESREFLINLSKKLKEGKVNLFDPGSTRTRRI